MTIDPALNVPCPTCRVGAGKPCRSRHAVSIHRARREALADLGVQAGRLLAASRQELRRPVRQGVGPPEPVLVGRTGGPVPDDGEDWPPWEPGPGCAAESNPGLGGVQWCPVHRRHEELHPA